MKYICNVLLLFVFSFCNAQKEISLCFKDMCGNSINQDVEYSFYSFDTEKEYFAENGKIAVPEKGRYLLSVLVCRADLRGSLDLVYEIDDKTGQNDTIEIPKILFSTTGVLHSSYWEYSKCGVTCEGNEIDYYANGNKRLEGIFKKGKPVEIVNYTISGIRESKYFYERGMLYKRIEYYDEAGSLIEYEVHENRKRKTIKRIYNAKGKLLRKEIEENYLVKYTDDFPQRE